VPVAREPTSEHLPVDYEPRRGELSTETEARDALRTLAALPHRQRRYLTLLITGHSYREIARHHGTTPTAVNRHLVRRFEVDRERDELARRRDGRRS
jgi:DNA-directed RNA polymerase specialized sigma24 family protein